MQDVVCSYLGLEDDPETVVAFPSPRNRCYRREKIQQINVTHQSNYCMQSVYSTCPIFLLKTAEFSDDKSNQVSGEDGISAAAPSQAFTHPQKEKSKPRPETESASSGTINPSNSGPSEARAKPRYRTRDVVLPFLTLAGIVAIISAAIIKFPASGYFIFSTSPIHTATPILLKPSNTPFIQITQTSPAVSLPPTKMANVLALPSKTPVATATATATPVTPTIQPSSTWTLQPSRTPATPCGIPYGWVAYTVKIGDTLSMLSVLTRTSISQLQIANCLGNSTNLLFGTNIYLPFIPVTQVFPSKTSVPPATPTFTVQPEITATEASLPTGIPTEVTLPAATTAATEVPATP
jgi:hypothetical protein